MSYFRNKVILITGANGGLGSEMARQLDAQGAKLILTDIGDAATLQSDNVLGYVRSDLLTRAGCEALVAAAYELSEQIDILINNAGVASAGDFVDVPDPKWEAQIAVNLIAPMTITKLLLPKMIARRSGHIVNISSVGGYIATPKTTTYAATKFAIRAFGIALYGEVKPYNIEVSNVYPFFTNTPIVAAERFGEAAPKDVPRFLIAEPPRIIRNALRGVEKRQLHVFPSTIAWLISRIAGTFPGLSGFLTGVLVKATK